MDLSIKPEFDSRIFKGAFATAKQRAETRIVDMFISAGKAFNAYAQNNKGFENRTFSLISSIGFIVVKDGNIVHEEFIDGGNAVGREKGLKVAREEVEQAGLMLIGVAGEDYALYVESKNRDVITGSAHHVSSLLRSAMG